MILLTNSQSLKSTGLSFFVGFLLVVIIKIPTFKKSITNKSMCYVNSHANIYRPTTNKKNFFRS